MKVTANFSYSGFGAATELTISCSLILTKKSLLKKKAGNFRLRRFADNSRWLLTNILFETVSRSVSEH